MELTIGTRGSRLALAQSEWVKNRLEEMFPELRITLCLVETSGDKDSTSPLAQIPVLGAFTKELDRGLLQGAFDLAVHSLKDVPCSCPEGILIGAIPEREDPSDAFCSHTGAPFSAMPKGAIIGTSSPRRQALLRLTRSDIYVRDIRGNVDTRLRKLYELKSCDALVLAAAGLRRLNLSHHITECFSPVSWPGAPGQGALAVAVRADNLSALSIVRRLEHPPTRYCTTAERAVLAALGGGCKLPLGVFARANNEVIELHAALIDLDGKRAIRVQGQGTINDPVGTGKRLADKILAEGGSALLNERPAE